MRLSPTQQLGEPISKFRFRYAAYSFKWAVAFAIPLLLLVSFQPNVLHSQVPLLIMGLYVGLPIGFGMAFLATIGFVIGGVFAHRLESSSSTHWLWPRVKFCLSVLFLAPFIVFALYWFVRGVMNFEVQAIARGGIWLITPQSAPLFFWVSLFCWAAFAFGIPVYLYRHGKRIFCCP